MSAQPVLAFSDLDRTLIYSQAATDTLSTHDRMEGRPAGVPPTTCVELYEGRPQSYVTQGAVAALEALALSGCLVPTTTRTPEQYLRVRLPGPPPRFAICANGGRLLVDGRDDDDHCQDVVRRLAATSAPLGEVLDEITALTARAETTGHAPEPFVERVRVASDLFCYLIVDRPRLPQAWLAELEGVAAGHRWGVSLQGRKLYVVPAALTKSAAAAEVVRRTDAEATVAAGDSLLDADLLQWADAAIRPRHGELADAGWTAGHLEVTSSTGVQAGEEIAHWLHARVLRRAPPSTVVR